MAIPLFCGNVDIADAYTYSGVTSTVDKVAEDENEFIVTNSSKITSNNNISPQKLKTTIQEIDDIVNVSTTNIGITWFGEGACTISGDVKGLPNNISNDDAKYILGALTGDVSICPEFNGVEVEKVVQTINKKYGTNISVYFDNSAQQEQEDWFNDLEELLSYFKLSYDGKTWTASKFDGHTTYITNGDNSSFNNGKKTITSTENLGDASITVSNSSTLIGQGNVQTSKNITVSDKSVLKATGSIQGADISVSGVSQLVSANYDSNSGSITGNSIVVDGNILAGAQVDDWTADGMSSPNTSSQMYAFSSIKSNGLLKATVGGIAAQYGSIEANSIESAKAIYASNSITAGGNITSNDFEVAGVNASSATITGNQSIGGIFTASGKAQLNGGAALNGQKITGLGAGTVDADSTDAVTGAQLFEVKQMAQNGGKTYSAGTNITIDSANKISVSGVLAYDVNSKDGTLDTSKVTLQGAQGTVLTGLMQGAITDSSTDAVSGAQLFTYDNKISGLSSSVKKVQSSIEDTLLTVNANASNVSSMQTTIDKLTSTRLNQSLSNISTVGINKITSIANDAIDNYMKTHGLSITSSDSSVSTLEAKDNYFVATVADTVSKDLYADNASNAVSDAVTKDYVDGAISDSVKDLATKDEVSNGLALKADKSYVDDQVKDLNTKIDTKADKPYVDEQLNTKADLSYVNDEISKKADVSYVDQNLALKADTDASNIDVDKYTEKLDTGAVKENDAGLVSGGKVYSAIEDAKKESNAYTNLMAEGLTNRFDSQLSGLESRLSNDINKGVAGASALAALKPLDYDSSDKFNFAVGYGHYRNANATALGAFYYFNANTMLNVGATLGNGSPAVNAGLSFKLGHGSDYAGVSKADLVKTNKALSDEVARQNDDLASSEQRLQALEELVGRLNK